MQNMDRHDVARLWQEFQVGDTPGWPDGLALEYMIVGLFELDGAKVSYSFNVVFHEGAFLSNSMDSFSPAASTG
jgi:hypothetical protein